MDVEKLVPSLELCRKAEGEFPEEYRRDFDDSYLGWMIERPAVVCGGRSTVAIGSWAVLRCGRHRLRCRREYNEEIHAAPTAVEIMDALDRIASCPTLFVVKGKWEADVVDRDDSLPGSRMIYAESNVSAADAAMKLWIEVHKNMR